MAANTVVNRVKFCAAYATKRLSSLVLHLFCMFLGKEAEAEEHTASFAQEMMNNFVDDLNFYLERAPEMRRELLMYF